ncbi:MAG: hypothetical protein GY803_27770, partial [Chloroflexi bacterium]|nr:hypothetical protein [Chloroflexota bacterium]
NEPAIHQAYAMVDSSQTISEANETNNIAGPLAVNVIPYLTLLNNCGSGPEALIYVFGNNWPPDEVISLFWDDVIQTQIQAHEHNGSFNRALSVPAATGLHEMRAVASSGLTVTSTFTVPCPSLPIVSPDNIIISGPTQGFVGASYNFTATVNPISTTLPLTYTWEATGQTAVTHTVSSRTDIISFTWPVTGTQTVTVTASKGTAVVSDTHTITINPLPAPADLVIGPLELVTPQPVRPYDPVQFRTTISNTGDIDITNQFFVDIYLDPAEVYRDSIPGPFSDGYIAIDSLAGGASIVVTITAAAGFANEPAIHQAYAMVDSSQTISEANETNNIAGPLAVNVIPYLTLLNNCGS